MRVDLTSHTRPRFRSGGRVPAATLPFLVAAALSWWPVSPSASQPRVADAHMTAPGDDFFAYANREWLAATELPPGKDRWGARDELEALARGRIAALLADASAAPAGTVARAVADF